MYKMSFSVVNDGEISLKRLKHLEALYAPNHEIAVSGKYLGRSIRPLHDTSSGICKYAKYLFRVLRAFANPQKAQGKEISKGSRFTLGADKGTSYAAQALGGLNLALSSSEIRHLRILIDELRKQAAFTDDPSEKARFQKEIQDLEKKHNKVLKNLAIASTFLGLGVGSVVAEMIASRGLNAAGFVAKAFSGVGGLLNLALSTYRIKHLVDSHTQLKEKAKDIDLFARDHLSALDSASRDSGAHLINAYKNRVKKLHSNHRFNSFMAATELVQALLSFTAQTIIITGLFVSVSAAVALTPIGHVVLALLGLCLLSMAVRLVYENGQTWMLNLRQVQARWQEGRLIHEQKRVDAKLRHLDEGIAQFGASKRIDSLVVSKNKQLKRRDRIEHKIEKLHHAQHQLACAKVQACYRKVFKGPSDLESIGQLADAALTLRKDQAGTAFLEGFFKLFGKQVPELNLETAEDLYRMLCQLPEKEMPSTILEHWQDLKTMQKDDALDHLHNLSEVEGVELREELAKALEPKFELQFLGEFQALFASM